MDKFVKWEPTPCWMRQTRLKWYFDERGVLMKTRVARKKADRGAWILCNS